MSNLLIILLVIIVIGVVIYIVWSNGQKTSNQFIYENGITRAPVKQAWVVSESTFGTCRDTCEKEACLGFMYDEEKKVCSIMPVSQWGSKYGAPTVLPAGSKVKTYLKSDSICEDGSKPIPELVGENDVIRISDNSTLVPQATTEALCTKACLDNDLCTVAVRSITAKPEESCRLLIGSSIPEKGQGMYNSYFKIYKCAN